MAFRALGLLLCLVATLSGCGRVLEVALEAEREPCPDRAVQRVVANAPPGRTEAPPAAKLAENERR